MDSTKVEIVWASKVLRAADLIRAGEMAVTAIPDPEHRSAIGELLRAVVDRLNEVAGELHDWPELAA